MDSKKTKHVAFAYDTCNCWVCKLGREVKKKEQLQQLQDLQKEARFGPNWKNILSGLGDQ